jgi:IS5 family transposase
MRLLEDGNGKYSEIDAGKSVIHSRVEHVFADQKSQTRLFTRTVGITRVSMKIGLANIVYNMHRFRFMEWIITAAEQSSG